MKLKEFQGKGLFKKYNIAIPAFEVVRSPVDKPSMIAKAQVLEGKRGKKGLIKNASKENVEELLKHCDEVLIEDKLEFDKEFYLSLIVDKNLKEIVVLFSEEGGIDIEEVENVLKIPYSKIKAFPKKEFLPLIEKMYKLMIDYKALLVEINPLVETNGEYIALDSKVILDDNVEYEDFKKEQTDLEKESSEYGLSYVELEGDVAIIGNGAGLVMATLDMVNAFGGKAANFLDIGGGASVEKIEKAVDIVMRKKPKVIFVNIFGGITRCDDVANALVSKKNEINVPMFVRIIGTNDKEACKFLEENDIHVYDSMEECAREVVKSVN